MDSSGQNLEKKNLAQDEISLDSNSGEIFSDKERKNGGTSKGLILGVLLAIVLAVVVGGIFLYSNQDQGVNTSKTNNQTSSSAESEAETEAKSPEIKELQDLNSDLKDVTTDLDQALQEMEEYSNEEDTVPADL